MSSEEKKGFFKGSLVSTLVFLVAFSGASFALAVWSAPTASPPNCPIGNTECGVALTTSNEPQSKSGRLGLSSIFFPDYVITGNITNPNRKVRLEVGGMLRLNEDSVPSNRCAVVSPGGDSCVTGDPGVSCDASLAGSLKFNKTTKNLEFCDGLGSWKKVTTQ